MPDNYNLYALELEPVRDEHAKWYVGITTDVDRRMAEHYRGGMPVQWVSRNEAIDHAVVGQWHEGQAREFEDELTGLLVHEFGYQVVRGGRYTKAGLRGTLPQDPMDPKPELVEALVTTNHDELVGLGDCLSATLESEPEQEESLCQE